jgi:hypothetical protein
MSKPDIRYFAEDGTWVKPVGAKRVTVVLKGGNSTLGHGAPPDRIAAYLAAQDAPRTRTEIAAGLGVSEPEADRYLGALLRADRLEVTGPHGTLLYWLLPARPAGTGGHSGGAFFGYGADGWQSAAAPAHGANDGELAARDLRAGALPPLVEVRVGEGGYALIVTHLTGG